MSNCKDATAGHFVVMFQTCTGARIEISRDPHCRHHSFELLPLVEVFLIDPLF